MIGAGIYLDLSLACPSSPPTQMLSCCQVYFHSLIDYFHYFFSVQSLLFSKVQFPLLTPRSLKEKSKHWNMRVWKCEKLIFTYYFCRCPVVKKTENLTQSCFLNTSFFLFLLSVTCWDHWHRTVDSWGPRDSRERREVSSLKLTQRFVKSNPDSWIR